MKTNRLPKSDDQLEIERLEGIIKRNRKTIRVVCFCAITNALCVLLSCYRVMELREMVDAANADHLATIEKQRKWMDDLLSGNNGQPIIWKRPPLPGAARR